LHELRWDTTHEHLAKEHRNIEKRRKKPERVHDRARRGGVSKKEEGASPKFLPNQQHVKQKYLIL